MCACLHPFPWDGINTSRVCVCVCVRERLHGALSVWCTDDEMCFRSISTISV